ncbi:MAG TPA: hypothetical protein ENK73_03505, partial [Thiomicrospira sp.]|nr:hypothetical protein [Thiomicrospira sp.]
MFKITLQSLCLVLMFTFSTQALSQQTINTVDKTAPDNQLWKKISTGTATWLFMDIYNATLFAQQETLPVNFLDDGVPLKLQLCYLKPITPDIFIEGAN